MVVWSKVASMARGQVQTSGNDAMMQGRLTQFQYCFDGIFKGLSSFIIAFSLRMLHILAADTK